MSDKTSTPTEAVVDSGWLNRTIAGVDLQSPWTWFGIVASLVLILVPLTGNGYYVQIVFLILMWTGLASSWNIIGGYTGYVSFGHGAFFALGGFTIALGQEYFSLAESFGVELVGILLLAGLIPMAVAAIIAYPFLRLSGGYFAIAMLGFQLALGQGFTALDILGGGIGLAASISKPPVAFLSSGQALYYILAVVVLITVLAANYIRKSEFGYGLFAIRENEDAAESIAVPTTRYKMLAFVISAFFPGIIGGIYAYQLSFITASSMFALLITLNMIVYTVVGGLGTVAGPFIGSVIMVLLKNVALTDISEAHVFFTGLFIVIVMLGFPRGVVGLIRDYRKGELSVPFVSPQK
jgi:branched-chain amino acid transport system permease protein